MKNFLIIAAVSLLFSSCLKQSIADAMLNKSGKQSKVTATLNYEINGKKETVIVEDADNQIMGSRRLYCEKSGGYVLSAIVSSFDFIFTFHTDTLKVGNYKYTSNYGPMYVTTFQRYPNYVVSPTDHMSFTVTSHIDGHISGTFSGQLTPAISQNMYGTPGSVLIKNGTFTNVPVYY